MADARQNFATGTPWEPVFGYSRAVRIGNRVWVSGTSATDAQGRIVEGDAYAQTKQVLKNIEAALVRAGSSMHDVVRTRIYVVRRDDCDRVGRAHGEAFGAIRPAAAMVVVSALVDPAMLVEIEADAVVGS
jgi:enamine deaminase RidA (YjgF/YER057c/UK114 family)